MKAQQDKYKIPLKLKKFVQVLMSEDVMGNKKEAERRTGVLRDRFYKHYEKHEEFRQYYSDQCDLFLNSKEHVPAMALLGKCAKGNILAIRTFYELKRKLKLGGINIDNSVKVLPNVQITFTSEKVGEEGVDANLTDENLYAREGKESNRIKEQV